MKRRITMLLISISLFSSIRVHAQMASELIPFLESIGISLESNFGHTIKNSLETIGMLEKMLTSANDQYTLVSNVYNTASIWAKPEVKNTIDGLYNLYGLCNSDYQQLQRLYQEMYNLGLVDYREILQFTRDIENSSIIIYKAILATTSVATENYLTFSEKVAKMTAARNMATKDVQDIIKQNLERLELLKKTSDDKIAADLTRQELKLASSSSPGKDPMEKIQANVDGKLKGSIGSINYSLQSRGTITEQGEGASGSPEQGRGVSDSQVHARYGSIYKEMSADELGAKLNKTGKEFFNLTYVIGTVLAILFSAIAFYRKRIGEHGSQDVYVKVILGYLIFLAITTSFQQIFLN